MMHTGDIIAEGNVTHHQSQHSRYDDMVLAKPLEMTVLVTNGVK